MDAATKTGLDALKTATKKVVHEESEATGKFIGKKNYWSTYKSKPVSDGNLRSVEEIIISPEKREEILNELRKVL